VTATDGQSASEGSRATREALATPTRENIRRYLRVHIDDEVLVTDELVDYIHRAHTWSPAFDEARKQSVSVPHDYTPELAGIQAPVLLIHGRYDRMVAFEVSIAILNHVTNSRVVLLNHCGHCHRSRSRRSTPPTCWPSSKATERKFPSPYPLPLERGLVSNPSPPSRGRG